jgi:hypothetical protein
VHYLKGQKAEQITITIIVTVKELRADSDSATVFATSCKGWQPHHSFEKVRIGSCLQLKL